MKNFLKLLIIGLFLSALTSPSTTLAAITGNLAINQQDIGFSSNNFLEGQTIRIYSTVNNPSGQDLLGTVRFFDNGKQIGGDQGISVFAGKNDDVFINWTPTAGNHLIAVKIFPWKPEIDNTTDNTITTTIFVIQDTDHDGIPNTTDDDDDGDGVIDSEDDFPLNAKEQKDTDGDGKGDGVDTDDDNDGVPDISDDLPLDPNETIDTDKDKIGNIADTDDDGDGISDMDEEKNGTNPTSADTDLDGANDSQDAFPLDQSESLDTDKDTIGNNSDTDDDNDGIPDDKDAFPLNKAPIISLSDNSLTIDLNSEHLFDATPSHDEDGEIVSYQWEIDSQISKEGNAIEQVFQTPGPHRVKLTVTDNSGESLSKEFEVNVVNLKLYKEIGAILLVILLAIALYFKYIATENLSKKT